MAKQNLFSTSSTNRARKILVTDKPNIKMYQHINKSNCFTYIFIIILTFFIEKNVQVNIKGVLNAQGSLPT